jgi:ABC-2 type transport system ATP-binding protein
MIQARGLTRNFGNLVAVDRLDLDVSKGEVFGFLGPNGAGKTTTIRMLAALIAPTSGEATVSGERLGTANQSIRRRVGVLTEMPGLYRRLSAWDNLMFFARLYETPNPAGQAEKYLRLFDLWDRRRDLAGGYSKGMRQKLAIARALLHEPAILFLDEPTAGLDPEAAKVVRDLIEALKSGDRTIFLCTHNLDEADRLCDRVALFKTRMIRVGEPEQLREAMYGRRTVVHLAGEGRDMEAVVRGLPFVHGVEVVDGRLVVSLDDPEKENPALVRRLVEAGAEVRFVNELRVSLEDLYLDLMEGDHAAT